MHGDRTDPTDDIARLREERLLLARYRRTRDPRVRDEIVARWMPLARRLALRYNHGDEPLDDLLQVAALGLVKAVERFDPAREVAFSSYAVPTIAGELKRHFRDRTWSLRVPRDLQELALKAEIATRELTTSLGRAPTVPELADQLGASHEAVLDALQARRAHHTTSLHAPRTAGEDGETLGDTLGDVEHGFASAEHRATIDMLMRELEPREREILRLRFEEDLTQEEIGARVGLSQMQVSRLIRRSLSRLTEIARSDGSPSDVR